MTTMSLDPVTIGAVGTAAGAVIGVLLTQGANYLNSRAKATAEVQKQYDDRADKGYTYVIEQQAKRISELEQAVLRLSNAEAECLKKSSAQEATIMSLRENQEDNIERILRLEAKLGLGSDRKPPHQT